MVGGGIIITQGEIKTAAAGSSTFSSRNLQRVARVKPPEVRKKRRCVNGYKRRVEQLPPAESPAIVM